MVRIKICKINSTNPSEKPEVFQEVDVLADKEHEIILYNDDVNTFDHVIACLVKIDAVLATSLIALRSIILSVGLLGVSI
ncbi:ATP-dependent Clp protease adaptor ClpS [Flavobacteriaceae bacterium]|nr:ATP-dependent Clp protease adaptor ClpS [Flavobacteriaceae bacterium]